MARVLSTNSGLYTRPAAAAAGEQAPPLLSANVGTRPVVKHANASVCVHPPADAPEAVDSDVDHDAASQLSRKEKGSVSRCMPCRPCGALHRETTLRQNYDVSINSDECTNEEACLLTYSLYRSGIDRIGFICRFYQEQQQSPTTV